MGLNHDLDRWMYRGGRPNRLARALNRTWATAASVGLAPEQLVTLEVRGRRTGATISFPLVVARVDGERYLVSMLGDQASWVRNVRAADGHAVLRRRRREPVRLEEVDPARRAPILRRYLARAPGARAHIAVDPDAPDEDLERVAAAFPVFHVVPDAPVHTSAG